MSAKKLIIALTASLAVSSAMAIEEPCDPATYLRKLVDPQGKELTYSLKPHELDTRPLDRDIINDIRKGEEYTYFVDAFGNGHYMKGAPSKSEKFEDFFLIQRPGSKDAYVVREYGHLTWNNRKRVPEQEMFAGWDLSKEEAHTIAAEMKKASPKTEIHLVDETKRSFARDFDCIKKNTAKAKGFLDAVSSSMTATVGSVATFEILGQHSLSDRSKRNRSFADVISAGAGKAMDFLPSEFLRTSAFYRKNPVADYLARNAVLSPMNSFLIKKPIYSAFSSKKSKILDPEAAKNIPYFDTAFGMVQYFPKRYVDNLVMEDIPTKMALYCANHPDAKVFWGPKMVRFSEKYAWGMVYYVSRNSMANSVQPARQFIEKESEPILKEGGKAIDYLQEKGQKALDHLKGETQ